MLTKLKLTLLHVLVDKLTLLITHLPIESITNVTVALLFHEQCLRGYAALINFVSPGRCFCAHIMCTVAVGRLAVCQSGTNSVPLRSIREPLQRKCFERPLKIASPTTTKSPVRNTNHDIRECYKLNDLSTKCNAF